MSKWLGFASTVNCLQFEIYLFQDERRQKEGAIGSVMDHAQREDRVHIKSKTVSFSWQRGNKIGT